jgi:hypothetical protein
MSVIPSLLMTSQCAITVGCDFAEYEDILLGVVLESSMLILHVGTP